MAAKKTALPSAFKRKDHGKMRDYSAIPSGEYVVAVVDSEYCVNKKKNGHYLKLVSKVQTGDFKDHSLYIILNLDNPSEGAEAAAHDELATICDAVGKAGIKDSKELHGIKHVAKVVLIPEGDGKPAKNEIVMYEPISGGKPSAGFEDDEDDEKEEEVNEKDDDKDDDDDNKDENEDSSGDEVSAEEVKTLARKYKELTNKKKMTKLLEEYDVEKISGISDLSSDDLESLKDDLEDAIEDEE